MRGLVGGLDPAVQPLVSSQSYTIAGEYPTHPAVVHLDLYRLNHVEEVMALGFEELVYSEDKVAIVEWPELLVPLLDPDDPLVSVDLEHRGDDRRSITLRATTGRLQRALMEISTQC